MDSDYAGRTASKKIATKVQEMGFTCVGYARRISSRRTATLKRHQKTVNPNAQMRLY
jgi:hypothetical protein